MGFHYARDHHLAGFWGEVCELALVAAKHLVNEVSLPPFDRLLDAFTSFGTALGWPEAQNRTGTVLERGLQRDADFEKNWPDVLGTLVDTEKKGASR